MAQACGGDSENPDSQARVPALWIWGFVDFVWCVSWVALEDPGRGEWSASAFALCLCIEFLSSPSCSPAMLVLFFQSCLAAAVLGVRGEFQQGGFRALVLPQGGKVEGFCGL